MSPETSIRFSTYNSRARACFGSLTGFHADGAGAIPANVAARANASDALLRPVLLSKASLAMGTPK
jgi:hypothetical protein